MINGVKGYLFTLTDWFDESSTTLKDSGIRIGTKQSCAMAKMTARCALYKQIVSRCGDMAI